MKGRVMATIDRLTPQAVGTVNDLMKRELDKGTVILHGRTVQLTMGDPLGYLNGLLLEAEHGDKYVLLAMIRKLRRRTT